MNLDPQACLLCRIKDAFRLLKIERNLLTEDVDRIGEIFLDHLWQ